MDETSLHDYLHVMKLSSLVELLCYFYYLFVVFRLFYYSFWGVRASSPPPPLSVDLCVRASSPPISVDLCVRARGLFQQLLSHVSDRRELFRLGLVHWCVRGQGPRCLRERFRTIGEVRHSGTRGSSNLFLPSVNGQLHLGEHGIGTSCLSA